MAGLTGKTVLVTGGTGFIGGHVVEQLIRLGNDVIVIDIEVNPKSYFVSNQLHVKARFELCDIRDNASIQRVYKQYNPTHIIHLAAQTLVTTAFVNPIETFETNVMGTVNILNEARNLKSLERIVVASSDKAYGKTKTAYTEEHALKGDHPYDVSKSSTDLIGYTYFKTYNLPVVVTRFGNVYGEGDLHFDRIIPGICKSISRKEQLLIRSDGKYIRDYLYVKDVADGYITLLNNKKNINGQAYNFSSQDKLSVLEVIDAAEKALGVKVNYKILNNAKNEIPYQHLNDGKIQKLGWKTTHTLSSTFVNVYDWYDQYLRNFYE